jgi:2-dehydro-3-deoxygalactonokinase
VSHAADAEIVGVNWGSSNFRAWRIAGDGSVLDEIVAAKGVAGLNREGMAEAMAALAARWPDHGPIYASGMIGSNIGWAEAPYALAPAGMTDLAAAAIPAEIGESAVRLVPGIACRRAFDGAPDILRGEEAELLGLMELTPGDGVAALPGTHTKWVRREGGKIGEFLTAMSGEIFDRLTAQGLLASIVEGEAVDGAAFLEGVARGRAGGLGLASLLFGARARVIRGDIVSADSASYIRGLLIGSEIADALAAFPDIGNGVVPLIGNGPLSRLYAAALGSVGIETQLVESRRACLLGFRAIHRATVG